MENQETQQNNAVVLSPYDKLKNMIKKDEVQDRFKQMLGNNSVAYLMSVLNCVQNNDKLAKADPNTVLMAAAVAATLNLPIDPNLGAAYIIPYWDSQKGVQVAQFQIGYKGIIALCHRSKEYNRINATDVREGEIEYIDRLTGDISFKWVQDEEERDKLPIIGYLSYFRLVNGFEKQGYMTVKAIEAHAKKYSKTYKNGNGTWKDDKDSMSKKTVLKLLLDKYGPKSVELIKAIRADQGIIEDFDGQNIRYIDNPATQISIEENNLKVIRDRVINHINTAKSKTALIKCQSDIIDDDVREMYNEKLASFTKK